MKRVFQRIAIVNRGEAAMRFIHAVREFNEERRTTLRTIALFTEPERNAMFVREADEAVCLGDVQVVVPGKSEPRSSYMDYERLARALREACVDAVWPGWGFVAEHAAFVDLCKEMNITFIGPDGPAMRRLADKIAAKTLAEETQIPVVPWSRGAVESMAEALRSAERLGFPLMLKPARGGQGKALRKIHSPKELRRVFEPAMAEAFESFGDPTLFLERLLQNARLLTVPVIADRYGTAWGLGIIDCTVQREHRNVLAEASSFMLSSEEDRGIREAAVRLFKGAGFQGIGSAEFLYEPQSRCYWFLEANTSLEGHHVVTECTTGIDLVKLQIHIARGGRLDEHVPLTTAHAISATLRAQSSGAPLVADQRRIQRLRMLSGPGVRVDRCMEEGDRVLEGFDETVARITGYGQDRKEALSRLQRAIRESVVVVDGGTGNKPLLLELLNCSHFQKGKVHTGWLDQQPCNLLHSSRTNADIALLHAAIRLSDAEFAIEQAQFYASALRGRPQVSSEVGRRLSLEYRGQHYLFAAYRVGPQRYRVVVDGSSIDVDVQRRSEFEYWLTAFGQRFHIVSVIHGRSCMIEVDGIAQEIHRDDGGVVHATSPAVISSIVVKTGDSVSVGDRLVILESMKMEMPVFAPFSGRVKQVLVLPNTQVNAGTALLQIEPDPAREEVVAGERVVFATLRNASRPSELDHPAWLRSLEIVRQMMLGFDVEPNHTGIAAEGAGQGENELNAERTALEDEILGAFVDICSLFRREPNVNHRLSAEEPSPESHLFAYLRMLDTRGEGLPLDFLRSLRTTLAHYGVHTLQRSPELEESMLWICKSHQRMEHQVAWVIRILELRLQRLSEPQEQRSETYRRLLDGIIDVANDTFPLVAVLARELRYRLYDLPLFERSRKQVYDAVEGHLAYMSENPNGPDRHERMKALVECPQPLAGILSSRFADANTPMRHWMLEAITRRYYRIRNLSDPFSLLIDGEPFLTADYEHEGKRIHLFSTHCEYAGLSDAIRKMLVLVKGVPAEHDIVMDFYTWNSGQRDDPDATEREVQKLINETAFPHPIRRIVVEIAAPGNRESDIQHYTFRPNGSQYEEDSFYRGLHPMMGKRLHLWRLSNFKIQRLASVEDVYLLHAVARDNPKDQRLFACAEVRDVTPVRDDKGRIVQLPHLERMFAEALAGIRQFQLHRKPHERLHWNRVLLYVWPPLALERDELRDIVNRLAPATEGLGLEQVVVRARIPNPATGELRETVLRISNPSDTGTVISFRNADKPQVIKPLTEYEQKVVRMKQRGLIYPYEIVKMLAPGVDEARGEFPLGDFVEHDLDADERLVPVQRPYGQNKANIIAGVIRNFVPRYPEGMTRVVLLGDPSKDLGALAAPECKRIIAALDLAQRKRVPLEWFPISAGARISMESGVENMDWIARVLRRLIEFTQAGGEVNLIVNGINVGAQPYWNAEATMLMHTRGILVMTPKAAMVLTGKRALEYSGSISAEDNQGIGGYDRIMGLNGQAQYWAKDIQEACQILLRHYDHTYVAPGERFPRRATTIDSIYRDVRSYPHRSLGEDGFAYVGEILSDATNPGRKKSFDIRSVMMAAIDQDHAPLERWAGMRAAETAVVWDAHLGGYPVCLIGIESHPVPRFGFVPADGPDQWSAGTLFPQSSKKVARAINAASNNRPLVLLANLSGFDGSPESMRRLQLEYGAEIGRAVVNFKGPMVFCVVSRYHGGAYVVFSRTLNEQMEVAALEGTYASVIGGAPAAAVVFAGEVEARAKNDPRLKALSEAMSQAKAVEKERLQAQWDELFKVVHSEKLGEMASEFDRVHCVKRALEVGALNRIIPAANLRPYLIDAVKRGIEKEEGSVFQKSEGQAA
jgi:acetyl/propionyl-CoA carboxylase alpha subunit/acetyl-CoA carboxylase carboxyltransferase component